MQQLSPHDARFVYADTTHANANVTLIHIYDQSTAPGGVVRFKSILQHIESRLSRSPLFRRKLMRVPMALDHPYWVDDEHFDLEYHVRHIALPKPGDWRQFCIQASRLHARALDFDRPLWEVYVVEGLDSFTDLPPGSFALVAKTHHAAIDLAQGPVLTELLHDLSPDTPSAPPEPWFPERPPGELEMLSRGLVRTAGAPLRLVRPLVRAVARLAPAALNWATGRMMGRTQLPPTRFNAVVSSYRVFETRRFALDDFRRIRRLADGASINDVVLAVCAGALRRYLDTHGELPARSLGAVAPIFLRGADHDPRVTPELSWMRVLLGTDIAEPKSRLEFIVAQTTASASRTRALPISEVIEREAPAATLALASKRLAGAQLSAQPLGRRSPLSNCTITNVPGPSQPLYLCGARMSYFSAMLPISDGMGLVLAVTSYDGRIIVSPTSCRELMPDPAVFATALRDAFEELLALARALPEVAAEAERSPPAQRAPRKRKAALPGRVKPPKPATRSRKATRAGSSSGRPARATPVV
jgi:WS/DGAT/MGAT family acyltransferase